MRGVSINHNGCLYWSVRAESITVNAMMTGLKYTFQAFKKDLFWLPMAMMTLFTIITVFIPESNKYNTARAFLGFLLPLITGGLSAYAFLADSALELQFTTKRPAWQMIIERLGIILGHHLFYQHSIPGNYWDDGYFAHPVGGCCTAAVGMVYTHFFSLDPWWGGFIVGEKQQWRICICWRSMDFSVSDQGMVCSKTDPAIPVTFLWCNGSAQSTASL